MKIDTIKSEIARILGIGADQVCFEIPPSHHNGDLSISLFNYVKNKKISPSQLADEMTIALKGVEGVFNVTRLNVYVNFSFDYVTLYEPVREIINNSNFGFEKIGQDKRIMVEYFSPNTNKPLHVGHLRNLFIGEALSNLLEAFAYKVIRTTLYNDRGIHISKAQLAYSKWGEGQIPNKARKKGDHFVGEYYVLFNKMSEQNPDLEKEAQSVLRLWEKDDESICTLWKEMRGWVIQGFEETFKRLRLNPFNKIYWESEFWEKGVKVVKEGLAKKIFQIGDDSTVIIQFSDSYLGTKPLLRADGTALYITQDIYLSERKYADYCDLDKSIYVVAAEQNEHFKAVFKVLELLGYSCAQNCYHLGYGMILIEGGKLKSREGISADADQIIDILENMAYIDVKNRFTELPEVERRDRALTIALSALK